MTLAIDVLMNEHREIERVLAALEAYAGELTGGRALERATLRDFTEFFRRYADACHHGKEEDLLFRRMIDYGFSEHEGPLAVMLYEHQLGRRHVGVLADVAGAAGAPGADDTQAAVSAAGEFVPLLRNHIVKEDRILYPMALRVLPPEELDRLAAQYEEFQARVVGAGAREELEALAARLVAAHPFDPAVLEAPVGMGCGV